mmetsp:Transcript_48073/g.121005  ORF Transcript_48073/g.121005 Transcript_48073/m.121005 type:complete len:206 (-) Transcript_48073:98-715(-)
MKQCLSCRDSLCRVELEQSFEERVRRVREAGCTAWVQPVAELTQIGVGLGRRGKVDVHPATEPAGRMTQTLHATDDGDLGQCSHIVWTVEEGVARGEQTEQDHASAPHVDGRCLMRHTHQHLGRTEARSAGTSRRCTLTWAHGSRREIGTALQIRVVHRGLRIGRQIAHRLGQTKVDQTIGCHRRSTLLSRRTNVNSRRLGRRQT